MKILYLNHVAYIGGAEIALLNILTDLNRERYTPVVCCPPGPLAAAVQALQVRWQAIPRLDGLNRYTVRHFVRHLPQLAVVIRGEAPDVIHANTNFTTQYAGPLCRWLRIPSVGHIRDIEPLGFMGRRVVRRNTRLLAISDAVAAYLCREGIPSTKITKVYDGVDVRQYVPPSCDNVEAAARKLIPRPPLLQREGGQEPMAAKPPFLPLSLQERGPGDEFFPGYSAIIGIIGQIGRRKGHHVLLEAIRELIVNFPNLQLWIVGREPDHSREHYTEQLQDYVRKHGLKKAVTFWGFRSDIPELLSQLDILVVPSLQEPFGKIVIEGMAMQKPVVASQVGGIPEIIVPGETGLLVPPGNAEALRQALTAVLIRPDTWKAMGLAGRQRVEACFTSERNVRQTEQIYEQLVSRDA